MQTATVRKLLTQSKRSGAWMLVTHQVNITAIAGLGAVSGEILLVEPTAQGVRVAGRIAPL